MKTNLIAVFLCLCIIATIPFTAGAENIDTSSPSSEAATTVTNPTSTTQPTTTQPVVTKINIANCNVLLGATSYIYSGEAKTPKVTVSKDDTLFAKGTDYTVAYSNNINAGTAQVVVTATATSKTLTGSVTKYFRIAKKDINSLKTKTLSANDFVYTGSEIKPTFTFAGNTLKLTLGKDYTVTYKNNKQIGNATITAKGTGNYTGTYSKKFVIRPGKVTAVKASKVKATTFRLSWSAVSGNIDGYRIYRLNPSTNTYSFAVSTKNTYFDVSGRNSATSYIYVVRAYRKVSGKNILGASSPARKVVMRPEKVTTVPSAYKGKNFVFKWEKTTADGYQIKYSKNKNLKKAKILKVASGKKTSYKVKLSSKTNFYYQIRAYKTIDGKTFYGAWSDKKTTQFSNVYSKYSTTFWSPAGRTANIKTACKYIDGTILRPGEVFSFNEVVGKRTPDRGFKVATVYSGQETVEGYGGGVCQVSSTIFNAVLYANLEIVERCQHSMTVHYVPYGRDAAISWGSADFRFKNTTNQDIKISAKVYNNSKVEIKLLTNGAAKPKKVSLNVTSAKYNKEFNKYVLTRSVGGKVNYTTSSIY